MRPGTLYVIAAPSGGGKTSLVQAITQENPQLSISVSYTTRPQRPLEKHGVHYCFVDDDEFERLIESHQLLEYARVYDHYYGTSKQWVEKKLAAGQDVILEIDWQGACQVKSAFPDNHVSIFILPPSRAVLEERLLKRAQDEQAVIDKRMAQAHEEISHCREFDYIVVNDDFREAVKDLSKIIAAQALKTSKQLVCHQQLLADLDR